MGYPIKVETCSNWPFKHNYYNSGSTVLKLCSDYYEETFVTTNLHIVIPLSYHSISGTFLICDYGYEDDKQNRDTFRAFRDHQLWDTLKEPGTADLTADVDFGYLKRHINDRATVFGTVTQEHFLKSLGIELRLSVRYR